MTLQHLLFGFFLWLLYFLILIFFLAFLFFRAAPAAYGSSQARSPIRAIAAGLHHSHSNARSEPCLQLTSQLTATPDPPTEQGQGSNPPPHGSLSDSFPLRHDGNSRIVFLISFSDFSFPVLEIYHFYTVLTICTHLLALIVCDLGFSISNIM